MELSLSRPIGNDYEAQLRVYACAGCGHELRLAVWKGSEPQLRRLEVGL
jgi:hypothetical protein